MRVRLDGKLAGPWVDETERAWRSLVAAHPDKELLIDLNGVNYVDAAGKQLLRAVHRQGTQLEGSGPMMAPMIEEISR